MTCASCGTTVSLDNVARLGSDARQRFRKAMAFSTEHGIDVASAYSVLLGFMSLEAASGKTDAAAPAQPGDEAPAKTEEARPEPRPQKRRGRGKGKGKRKNRKKSARTASGPTSSQSPARGKTEAPARPRTDVPDKPLAEALREAMARLPEKREATSSSAAAKPRASKGVPRPGRPVPVSKPRTSARPSPQGGRKRKPQSWPAIRPRRADAPPRPRRGDAPRGTVPAARAAVQRRKDSGSLYIWGIAGVVLIVGAFLTVGVREELAEMRGNGAARIAEATVGPKSSPRPTAGAEITFRTNAQGRLIEVAAARPEDVLSIYCREDTPSGKQPVAVRQAGDNWIGVFRQDQATYAMKIRKDSRSERWIAGDGATPIVVTDAHPLP